MSTTPSHDSVASALSRHTRHVAVSAVPDSEPARFNASILLESTLDATPAHVWSAIADTSVLSQWFGPVTGDIHTGGSYRVGNTSWGTIQSAVPERHFTATWNFDDRSTLLAVDLTRPFDEAIENTATLISVAHSSSVSEEEWNTYGVIAVGSSWDVLAYKFAQFLSDPEPGAAAARIAEWEHSESFHEFQLASVQLWTEATIQFGVPVELAEHMRANTLAALHGAAETA